MSSFEFNGFDELEKQFKKMSKAANDLGQNKEIPLMELFTDEFMRKNTKYPSLESFFDASGFDASTNEKLEAIPENKLDKFVAKNSDFSTWKEMLESATGKYISGKLGF